MTKCSALLIVVLACTVIMQTGSFYLPKRDNRINLLDPKKRPFCNAFTGCGRKRNDLPALSSGPVKSEPLEESIGSLLELSAEPAVEDISRQIMSEAKLWEAIQEANVELNRARQESAEHSGEDAALNRAVAASATCALPPCYI